MRKDRGSPSNGTGHSGLKTASELSENQSPASQVAALFDYSELAKAIETDGFRRLLDHIPIPILVAKDVLGTQPIIYGNGAFESLVGQTVDEVKQ